MQKPRFFRRRIVTDKVGQYAYGSIFALLVVAGLAGLLLALVVSTYLPSSACPEGMDGCPSLIFDKAQLRSSLPLIALMSVPIVAIAFVLGVVFSHRTFGPIVRISAFVDEISKGNYHARLTLRDRDHLKELVPLLNSMAEALDKRHGVNKEPQS